MPVKILLADKSITIQKVVEMLFSGKEYEVFCVSDGETALSDAARIVPDVILADVDLPRLDGYRFAGRLKETPALGQTPVILMMSRDDVYDEVKGRQAGIMDNIAKPFESQELIGKVKKALTASPPRLAEPATAVKPAPAPPRSVPAAPPAVPAKPKQTTPPDIWDIIEEAPTQAEIRKTVVPPAAEDESVFEVEPEVEVEDELAREVARALPIGEKAVEEMRAGLGLMNEQEQASPDIVNFESLEAATLASREYLPPKSGQPAAPARPSKPPIAPQPQPKPESPRATGQQTMLSEGELRSIAEKIITRMAGDVFKNMPPPQPPKISEDTVRRGIEEAVAIIAREIARDVIEKVAWEVIPALAEQMIKAEIERLKAEP